MVNLRCLSGYTKAEGTEALAASSSSVNREINLIRNVFAVTRAE
ncbi:ECF-type sigma factor [Paraburkholderia sp. GAS38]